MIRHALLAAALAACTGALYAHTTARSTGATAALPVFEAADLTPVWRSDTELRAQSDRALPEFSFQDQAGRTVTRATLAGRVVVANFFFAGCSTLCPRLRSSMARVRDAFASDPRLLLLSHSVTPKTDSLPLLAAYARSNNIDGERWRLLTGPEAMLRRFAREGYLLPPPEVDARGVMHTEQFVLLDGRQRVRGYYNGTLALEVDHLIEDVKALLAS